MEETNNITIKDVVLKVTGTINYLKSRWLVIVLTGMLGGAIGLTYAYFQRFVYYANVSFALEDEKGGGTGLSGALGLASQFGIDLGGSAGGAFTGANLIELMKSRTLVQKALLDPVTVNNKEISLVELYIQFNGLRKSWDKDPALKNIQFPPNSDPSKFNLQQDSLLGLIYQKLLQYNNLTIAQKDKKISIITVSVKSENELFSKVFCETVVREVADFYIETKSKKARLNVAILQKQADSVRTELNNAISNVASANDNTYNLNPALNINRVPSTKKQIDVQANTAILTQLVTNLELARMSLLKETPLIQIIDLPVLPLHKEKVRKSTSIVIGGIIGGIFAIFYLIGRRIWRKIKSDIYN